MKKRTYVSIRERNTKYPSAIEIEVNVPKNIQAQFGIVAAIEKVKFEILSGLEVKDGKTRNKR